VTTAVCCAVLLVGSAASVTTAEATAPHDRAMIVLNEPASRLAFSPDADGHRDVAVVRYRLSKPALVRARVVNSAGHTVRSYRLGHLKKGVHVLRWGGNRPGHGTVRDGRYRVVVRAVHASRPAVMRTTVVVDTVDPGLSSADVASNRTTVYPNTTLFTDEARFQLYTGDQSVTATVHRLDGTLVDTVARDVAGSVLLAWDGRDAAGQVLAAGPYLLRLTSTDAAGNRGSYDIPVQVSAQPLVEHIKSTTLPAGQWQGRGLPSGNTCGLESAQGCGDPVTCSPVPSDRFAGGLSFRGTCASTALWDGAGQLYSVQGETGHEQFRVTATGGPRVPGATDTATLNAVQLQGDGSFTTPWIQVTPISGTLRSQGSWTVRSRPASSYDIASFTVEQTYYAPAS